MNFPVVGIGASAGGLEALVTFFKAMPSDSGMCFILVTHLDPSHLSILPELIQKCDRDAGLSDSGRWNRCGSRTMSM